MPFELDWRFGLNIVLLLLLGLAASRAFSVVREDQVRAPAFFSMRGFAFGLTLALSFAVFWLWGFVGSPAGGTDGSSADSLTLFSIMIGAIGVVISVLTGISLTTAWRAIDDAGRALRETNDLMRQIDTKVLGAAKLGLEFQRLAALVEASNALNKVKGVGDERETEFSCQQLLDAFAEPDEPRTLAALGDIAGNPSILREMGSLGRAWLAVVATEGEADARRKAFRLLDALENARERA